MSWKVLPVFPLLLLSACSSYNHRSAAFVNAYAAHDMNTAVIVADACVQDALPGERILYRMEQGTVLRYAGQYEQSVAAFDVADDLLTAEDAAANVSITNQMTGLTTSQKYETYRGTSYDRIMVNVYKALDDMQLGDLEAARVELRRAYEHQVAAVELNAKRIAKAQQETSDKYDVERARQDDKFQSQIEAQYGDLSKLEQYQAYADYVNPFAEFLQALYYLGAGVDANDAERAAKCAERLAGMAERNAYVKQDMVLMDEAADGKPLPALTYVIFETGLAPRREEIRIDIPVFLAGGYSGGVDYAGAAFPKLVNDDDFVRQLEVTAGDQSLDTQVVCSMDSVIGREFEQELPIIITKTLISAGGKAAGAYFANEATRDDKLTNIAARVGMTLYQATMNQADLRTWRTLPKQFQYARLKTPADRVLTLGTPDGWRQSLTVEPGNLNVVYVKSVSPGAVPVVSQFVLKP